MKRKLQPILSNSDENKIEIIVRNTYKIKLFGTIIDEIPVQFQERNFELKTTLKPNENKEINYQLRPTVRGEYIFGNVHIYVSTRLGMIQKRFTALEEKTVKVYPSFLQLKKFQIHAMPDRNAHSGGQMKFKKGMSTEFDAIKEYNRGDDIRTINWKASARRNQIMVNSYMDEKSQTIYCIIDKGRLMKMPFNQLTLLDYSLNAALMFSYVALQKDDKIGLITFGEKIDNVLQPSKSKKQFNYILETLYKQESHFLESNFANLYAHVNRKAGSRSLLLLFTNFETYTGFERQLNYFRALNQKHVLVVVFLENTDIAAIHENKSNTIEDIYVKTIADKFIYEKKMILKELQKNGIIGIYITPEKLTINVVNNYLDLKVRQYL